jgi:HAE1 family hydrophobic/amphiphilic exporter-1
MMALSVIVLGWMSLFRLPLEYKPNLSFPAMYINVNYPSSSPEEIERNISRPIEEIMGTLSDVKSLSSSSYASRSSIRLDFDLDSDMDLVAVHIRDRLDRVRNVLLDDVERIEIRGWHTEDFPILQYAVTWGGDDPDELVHVWKQTIYPRLQRLEGVGSVEISGMAERALLVEVDQNLLNTHGLDIRSLNTAIRTNIATCFSQGE